MGRYNFSPQRVQTHAAQLLQNHLVTTPPPWYNIIHSNPPSSRLVRPALRRAQKPGKKSSRIFTPLKVNYHEDRLRWEYFNDHPWELARPRVVLEDDGRDRERWDWSVELDVGMNRPLQGTRDELGRTEREWERIWSRQAARPVNGESYVTLPRAKMWKVTVLTHAIE